MAAPSSDMDLLVQAAKGSRSAFHRFYMVHFGRVLAFLKRQTGDPELAKDLTQDVFFAAWRRAGAFEEGRGTVEQWLFAIARHKLFDCLRRIYHLRELLSGKEFHGERTALAQDECLMLMQALRGLPQDQERTIRMYYLEGLSLQECAESLAIPLGTVKWRLHSAVGKLRLAWKD